MWVFKTSASSPRSRPLSPLLARSSGFGVPSTPSPLRPERAAPSYGLGRAHREEVEGAVEVARPLRPQREVALVDRRREPTVEAVGELQAGVDRVPPRAQCPRVDAQLAGMEEPVELDAREMRRAQCPEFLGAVLVHVPRVARALGASRREREDVR